MAGNDPNAQLLAQLDSLYSRLGRPVFDLPGGIIGQDVPQSAPPGAGNIAPVGWVSNINGSGVATVVIDQTGITITDGALTIKDVFGTTVMTGGGFGSAWLAFLDAGGVYNADFGAGSIFNILSATVVGTASTDADYAASLSNDIPYWVVNSVASGSFARVADATSPSGYSLYTDATFDFEIFQDVPVTPGQYYEVDVHWAHGHLVGGTPYEFDSDINLDFRDATHGLVSGTISAGLAYTTDSTGFQTEALITSGKVPNGVRYMRVYLRFYRVSGGPTLAIGKVSVKPLASFASMSIQAPSAVFDFFSTPYDGSSSLYPKFRINTTGTLEWGAGGTSGLDVNLYRVTANALRTDDAFSIGQAAAGTQGFGMFVVGDSQYRFRIFQDGKHEWGPGGTSGLDVNLYRAAANELKTDDSLIVAGSRLDAPRMGVHLRRSGAWTIANGVWATTIDWDTVEWDGWGMRNSGDHTRIDIPSGLGGIWLVEGCWSGNAVTADVRLGSALFVNGVEVRETLMSAPNAAAGTQAFSWIIGASAGDYFQIKTLNNSGGSITGNVTQVWNCRISLVRLSS